MLIVKKESEALSSFLAVMSKENLETNFGELLTVIDKCLKEGHTLPGLILLYAHIDITASLNRPSGKDDVTRKDYKDWVNEFLLPGSKLRCSADDLYAARCGLIHSYMAEAKATRSREAKQIFYAWGTAKGATLQEALRGGGLHSEAVAIHVDELFEAFRNGLKRFMESLDNDPQKARLAYERAKKYFKNISVHPIGPHDQQKD